MQSNLAFSNATKHTSSVKETRFGQELMVCICEFEKSLRLCVRFEEFHVVFRSFTVSGSRCWKNMKQRCHGGSTGQHFWTSGSIRRGSASCKWWSSGLASLANSWHMVMMRKLHINKSLTLELHCIDVNKSMLTVNSGKSKTYFSIVPPHRYFFVAPPFLFHCALRCLGFTSGSSSGTELSCGRLWPVLWQSQYLQLLPPRQGHAPKKQKQGRDRWMDAYYLTIHPLFETNQAFRRPTNWYKLWPLQNKMRV